MKHALFFLSIRTLNEGKKMKAAISLTFLALMSLNTQAATLDFSSLVGQYTLTDTIEGACAPTLQVVEEDFLNQRAKHSLSLYGMDGIPETNIIYQLTNINAGIDFHFTTNPMFGQVDGSWYDLETLINNKINANTTVKNIFGITQWKTTLNAEFNTDSLKYTRTDYNILSGKTVTRNDVCEYVKN